MRVAIIGRTEILYGMVPRLISQGHQVALIVTAKEAPEYTKTSGDFKALAENLGVPFVHTPRIEEIAAQIRSMPEIDIGVSLNYSGVIPQSVIDLFPLGILNAHAGDLPRYRGNACQAWAIINGEERIGLCIHRMIGGELDSGDIVAREFLPIDINTTVTQAYDWMSERIPYLFEEALTRLEQDAAYVVERQSKDPKDALRCYPRKPEDGRIKWGESNVDILRLINASTKPFAGAFCYLEDAKLIVWGAELAPPENFLAVPGQVTEIGEDFVEVACGAGKIRLVKMEGSDGTTAPDKLFRSLRQRLG